MNLLVGLEVISVLQIKNMELDPELLKLKEVKKIGLNLEKEMLKWKAKVSKWKTKKLKMKNELRSLKEKNAAFASKEKHIIIISFISVSLVIVGLMKKNEKFGIIYLP